MVRKTVNLGRLRSPRYRRWRGQLLHPIEEVRMFFDDHGPVPETFRKLRKRLRDSGYPHIFLGAMAVNAHGLRRSTEDVDFCMRRDDLERFKREFVGKVYQSVEGRPRKFFDPETEVSFDILVAGAIAGNSRKQREVLFPDPDEAVIINDTPCVSLERLVELKLVTWRYQDWADVVNLIRTLDLDEAFAQKLNPVARPFYVQCYDQMVEEDHYNPEIHDRHPDEPEA